MFKGINAEILKITKSHHKSLEKHLQYNSSNASNYFKDVVPMFYNESPDYANSVLVLGINPSLNKKYYQRISELSQKFSLFIRKNKSVQKAIIKSLIGYQNDLMYGGEKHNQIPYFKSIQKFLRDSTFQDGFVHYDLYPFRISSSISAEKIKLNPELLKYHANAKERVSNVILKSSAKTVFILNRFVSEIVLDLYAKELIAINNFKLTKKGDKLYGHYRLKDKNIFLFKQITGLGTKRNELSVFKSFVKLSLKK